MVAVSEGLIERPDERALAALCSDLREAADAVGADGAWPAAQLQSVGSGASFAGFVPEEFGGLGWSGAETVEGFLQLSAACLTTTFVLTQLTGACRRIANCDNRELQAQLLPKLASGDALATLGISHLTTSRRHLGRPALAATAPAMDLNCTDSAPG